MCRGRESVALINTRCQGHGGAGLYQKDQLLFGQRPLVLEPDLNRIGSELGIKGT